LAVVGLTATAINLQISRAADGALEAKSFMTQTAVQHAHTNRLSREKSPYLLQHQHNPVDWFAWGTDAFEKARAENKPIFLSIGYSTCHWCHVMERESFESRELAEFLNAHFISIKVDREERPDIDQIYMTFVQATAGSGGWPLNVFLTPDRKPFYGGTYFPPEARYGRPSFLQVLKNIVDLWQQRHGDVVSSAQQLHQQLLSATQSHTNASTQLQLSPTWLTNAAAQFKQEYDADHGGFGGAPKFPRPSQPAFLLQNGTQFGDREAVEMVLHTCRAMAAGGMCDQIGGGFHRYAVDAEWLVPHFEKMLYDNAQLVSLYLDAYLVSGQANFAETARDIIRYVLRDMTHPDGGFYSAEDADSEGKEGKFYCWTRSELSALLTPEEFNLAVGYFGVTDKGNFVDHSDPNPLPNQNVLSVVQTNLSAADRPLLHSIKSKLLAARSKRVRPHLDDKILSSWNGLMLGAMARAYAVLGDQTYRAAAEKNLAFLQRKLWDPQTKTLYHRWRDGERDSVQLLDAYANLAAGVLELYEATLDPKLLQFAIELSDAMIARFYDGEHGGFFQTTAGASDLILRVKEDYDGAEPSGNSVAVLALLKLSAITDRQDFKGAAEKTLRHLTERLKDLPQAVPHLLIGLDFYVEEPRRVVIAGDPADVGVQPLIRAAQSVYQPRKVILGNSGAVEPFAKTLGAKQGQPMVFLCTGTACQAPTADPDVIKRLLR
jgi:uncharacterized protein YyaL (SSP411 family)